jgi:hypothetical protein
MANKKRAMVSPVPQTGNRPIIRGPLTAKLQAALKAMGNDRAYTILSVHGNTMTIHFQGDKEVTTIMFD